MFPNPSMLKLVWWAFLFKDNLCNVYHGFINVELMVNSIITHDWSLCNIGIFSINALYSFLHVEIPDSTQGRYKKQNQKHTKAQKCKKVAQKENLFKSESWNREQNVSLFTWECAHRMVGNLHHSAEAWIFKWQWKHSKLQVYTF